MQTGPIQVSPVPEFVLFWKPHDLFLIFPLSCVCKDPSRKSQAWSLSLPIDIFLASRCCWCMIMLLGFSKEWFTIMSFPSPSPILYSAHHTGSHLYMYICRYVCEYSEWLTVVQSNSTQGNHGHLKTWNQSSPMPVCSSAANPLNTVMQDLHEAAQGQVEEEGSQVPGAGKLLGLWPQLPEFCTQNPGSSSANLEKGKGKGHIDPMKFS